MKKRIGYVSNSSTSSFLIYGNRIDTLEEAKKLCEDSNNKVMCILEGMGMSGDCGDFAFTMTSERLELLKKHRFSLEENKYRARFFLVIKQWRDDEQFVVDKPLHGGSLFFVEKDYSSPMTDAADDKGWLDWLNVHA